MSTIDTLEAGRELDALVAEKVMGFKWHCFRDDGPKGWGGDREIRMLRLKLNVEAWTAAGWRPIDPSQVRENVETLDLHPVPEYSTDIAAAWEVVAAVVNRTPGTIQFILSALFPNSGDATAWGAQFSSLFGSDCWSEEADTAPLAICLAALKAIDACPPKFPNAKKVAASPNND